MNHGVSFDVTCHAKLLARCKAVGFFVQESASLNHVSNSRTKPLVPMLGSRAGMIDSYGIERAFDLGGIYMKDCHSFLSVNWVKPLRLQAPVHVPHVRILL